jgi:hypothetical protein
MSTSIWKKIGFGAAVAGGVIAGVALLPITLGFGGAGIAAGSVAAGIQAAIGNVAAGSVFAICTSLGMTGVFASSAAVGAILGTGGLVAYLNLVFNPENDSILIRATIDNTDNPDIIIKLLEGRFPQEREKTREVYENLYPGKNFDEDILNYVPINSREHVKNMLRKTSEIHAHTQNVKLSMDNITFEEYCKKKFVDYKDAKLIEDIINNNDNPLMIVRLLNYRDEGERKKIDLKFRERKGDIEKKMLLYIIENMRNSPEISYIHLLLEGI